jgi:pilus assembly protein CpaB
MQGNKRRGRIFIYLGLILILGLVAVVIFMQRLNKPAGTGEQRSDVTPTPQMSNVVAVRANVTRGSLLEEKDLTTIPFPQNLALSGTYFTVIEDVIGQRVKFDLSENTPLTKTMLVDISDHSFAASQIPAGMVAVSIPINRLSAVSYAPRPGDKVNVIGTMLMVDLDTSFQSVLPNNTAGVLANGQNMMLIGNAAGQDANTQPITVNNLVVQTGSGGQNAPAGRAEVDPAINQPFYYVPSEPQRPRLISQTLIQNVTVLQVGDFPLSEEEKAASNVSDSTAVQEGQPTPTPEAVKPPDVITLVVTPQDSVTLNYLLYSDVKLTLALRGINDEQNTPTESVTLKYLLDQYNIPVPEKLGYGLEPSVRELKDPKLSNEKSPTPQ